MSEIIYVRGDPKTTRYVQQLLMISGLIERSSQMYVTATHWGDIQAELNAQYRDALTDPTKPAPWDLHPNKPMQLGSREPYLTVINSGTDDQEVCNMLNEHPAEVAAFSARRDKLRIA